MNTISPWFPRIALDSFRCAFFFLESRLSDYLCKCCTVWFRNTHTLHFGIRSYIVQMRWCAYELCWVFLVVIMSQWWSLLYSYCMVLWWTPYHQDLRALVDKWWLAWWKPSTSAFSVTEPLIAFVTETTTFGTEQFRDEHIPHYQDFWRTLPSTQVWLTWSFLVCEEVPATITVIFAHLLPWHLQDVCSEFLFYMLAFCSVVLIV